MRAINHKKGPKIKQITEKQAGQGRNRAEGPAPYRGAFRPKAGDSGLPKAAASAPWAASEACRFPSPSARSARGSCDREGGTGIDERSEEMTGPHSREQMPSDGRAEGDGKPSGKSWATKTAKLASNGHRATKAASSRRLLREHVKAEGLIRAQRRALFPKEIAEQPAERRKCTPVS